MLSVSHTHSCSVSVTVSLSLCLSLSLTFSFPLFRQKGKVVRYYGSRQPLQHLPLAQTRGAPPQDLQRMMLQLKLTPGGAQVNQTLPAMIPGVADQTLPHPKRLLKLMILGVEVLMVWKRSLPLLAMTHGVVWEMPHRRTLLHLMILGVEYQTLPRKIPPLQATTHGVLREMPHQRTLLQQTTLLVEGQTLP